MLQRSKKYAAVLASAVLLLASASAPGEDKKDDKDKPSLSGTWARQEGQTKIEFSGKDVMKIYPHGDNKVIVVVCEYALKKEGLVKAKITELEGREKEKAKEAAPVGLEFSFKWQVKDDSATLDDLKGENTDALKSHVEGKYDQKK
jgi:hypothetical protein